VLPVGISSHLTRLGDDRVDTLREGVLEHGKGVLKMKRHFQFSAILHAAHAHQGFLTHLASLELLIVGQIKHVHDELGHCLLADPQEDVLTVLDQEQPVSL
jgi:hypothetical protein